MWSYVHSGTELIWLKRKKSDELKEAKEKSFEIKSLMSGAYLQQENYNDKTAKAIIKMSL